MARIRSDTSDGQVGLLLLILLSLILLITQRDDALERRSTPLLTSDIQAPVALWIGTPFRALEGAVSDAENSRRALEENKALRAELSHLRSENDRLQAMRERLRRLESLMNVTEPGDIPETRIAVRAVSDASSPFVRSLLIASGQNSGVKEGQAVLSDTGMVGHVVSAGRNSARVLRLDDLNSRVAVKSQRSGARAILAGANADRPSLAFISDASQWAVGDRVVTSGDDGQLPQGLPIGSVGEHHDVILDFRARPVDWVFVIPYDPPTDASDVDLVSETEVTAEMDGLESGDAPILASGDEG